MIIFSVATTMVIYGAYKFISLIDSLPWMLLVIALNAAFIAILAAILAHTKDQNYEQR